MRLKYEDKKSPFTEIIIRFYRHKDPEVQAMIDAIQEYRRFMGWSHRYFYLRAVAELINKDGGNPELVIKIINYLTKGQPNDR